MNTNQLLKCIREDSSLDEQCSGVHPVDRIPELVKRPECFILNLDPHYKKGSHWIAIYVDQEGQGEFFDTYGRKPHKQLIRKYLRENCPTWTFNKKLIQSPYSSVCGQHCLHFLYHRVRGDSMKTITEEFGMDLENNDLLVTDWVNEEFDINTNVFDLEFMLNQISHALLKQ